MRKKIFLEYINFLAVAKAQIISEIPFVRTTPLSKGIPLLILASKNVTAMLEGLLRQDLPTYNRYFIPGYVSVKPTSVSRDLDRECTLKRQLELPGHAALRLLCLHSCFFLSAH
jgi:hypothetical protein